MLVVEEIDPQTGFTRLSIVDVEVHIYAPMCLRDEARDTVFVCVFKSSISLVKRRIIYSFSSH